jgi:hypothetical protein
MPPMRMQAAMAFTVAILTLWRITCIGQRFIKVVIDLMRAWWHTNTCARSFYIFKWRNVSAPNRKQPRILCAARGAVTVLNPLSWLACIWTCNLKSTSPDCVCSRSANTQHHNISSAPTIKGMNKSRRKKSINYVVVAIPPFAHRALNKQHYIFRLTQPIFISIFQTLHTSIKPTSIKFYFI